MKTIVVIRHAKAESHAASGEDFDRKLIRKGKIEAELLVDRLIRRSIQPSIIISSPVIRALSTAEIIASKYKLVSRVVTKSFLYNRLYSFEDIEKAIVDSQCAGDTVFIVAHHPTILHLIMQMCTKKLENLNTSEAVVIHFDTHDWKGISLCECKRYEMLTMLV